MIFEDWKHAFYSTMVTNRVLSSAMVVPRFVCLDSSTLGKLAHDFPQSLAARDIMTMFNSGEVILFVTWHHIEELIQHRNTDVYLRRFDFLSRLGMLAFPKTSLGGVGSFVELRDAEFKALLAHPEHSFEHLVETARDSILNGCDTGGNVCRSQRAWWDYYRRHLAEYELRQKVEIASMSHFPVVDPMAPYPVHSRKVSLKPKVKAKATFKQMGANLAADMERAGDSRLTNPRQLASDLMIEAFDDLQQLYDKSDFKITDLLSLQGVDSSRLPKRPRIADVSYEGIFAQHLQQFGRRSLKDRNEVFRITQNKIPSWMIWREADQAMKAKGKASGSNLNDKYILPFGLYVDALDVDKRVNHLVRTLKGRSSLFQNLHDRLLSYERGSLNALARALKKLALVDAKRPAANQ